ncbi:plasminogen activator, urokinase a [Mugil cephalus]|uniref:plasminogen activator, urokinase a n=1 Tax=Mugil cephalus TaxID=48193 RepID=UPI001FB84A26|nr:plasminogen activator, urokinase a [Mugil cephalus]
MNLFVIIAALVACNVDVVVSRKRFKNTSCLSGDGRKYRGTVSTSWTGRRCLNWSNSKQRMTPSNGLGYHSYCRNPDQSLMPWCFVRREKKIVKEICNIPKCAAPPAKPTPPREDTERTCGERVEQRRNKIVGGSFTTIEAQPWIAAIFLKSERFLCGGSLISPNWVVTAAHCFSESFMKIDKKDLSVFLGKNAINDTDTDKEQSFDVEKIIVHPQYSDSNYDNDIALLKIKSKSGGRAVKTNSVRTVCLPPLHTSLPAGFTCNVAGFGKETQESWQFSQLLKQADVTLISRAECNSKSQYDNVITDNMLCARSPDWSTDACEGDSGGPLVCEMSGRMFLFGVVSWGEGCAKTDKPGVYTRVTNYNRWIAAQTGLEEYTEGRMYPIK